MMAVDQRRSTDRRPAQGSGAGGQVARIQETADDYVGAEILVQLHNAAASMRQHVEQTVLRRVRLSWTAFAVLRHVHARERVETRVVAAETGIAKATLTGVVNTLSSRGLVRRRAHPRDGRLVLIEATRAGRQLVRRITPAVYAEEAFILRGLSGKQVDQFSGVLLQLVQHLNGDDGRRRRR